MYILVPSVKPASAQFVADADVLSLNESNPANVVVSHFGQEYDISAQALTQRALSERTTIVSTEFVYDNTAGVNSIMGFSPIYDKKTNEFKVL